MLDLTFLYYLLTFLISTMMTLIIINHLHPKLDFYTRNPIGPQKIHEGNTSRLGGVSIFFTIVVISILLYSLDIQNTYITPYHFLILLPIFILGFWEDITQSVSPNIRLLGSFLSTVLLLLNFELLINDLGIREINDLLNFYYISFVFTTLCVIYLIQSFNIIDGLNGLCLLTSIIVFVSVSIIAFKLNDFDTLYFTVFFISILLGVLVFNFPFGKIFIGDSGAYIIGLLVSLSVLTLYKNNSQLSPYVIAQVLIYPSYELLRSYLRRLFTKSSRVFRPDTLHLHSILYKLNCANFSYNSQTINSITSSKIVCFQIINAYYLTLFYDNEKIIVFGIIVFVIIYEIFYYSISKTLKKLNIF